LRLVTLLDPGTQQDVAGTAISPVQVTPVTTGAAPTLSYSADGLPPVLVNGKSGTCLADPGSSSRNGTYPSISRCTGQPNQSWIPPAGPVASGIPGTCLDDTEDSSAPGTRAEL
jgi:hypothetical protein